MSRKRASTNLLIDETAAFARRLLKRASETRIGPQAEGEEPATPAVDLDTQTAVLSVVTRWVTVQHRLAPDKDDDSEFDRLRGRLGGGAKRAAPKRGAGGDSATAKIHDGRDIPYALRPGANGEHAPDDEA